MCSLGFCYVPLDKPLQDVKKGFHALSEHAALLHLVYKGMEPDRGEYLAIRFMGSEEEVIFYKEHIDTPSSLVSVSPVVFIVPPVLFLAWNGLLMRRSGPVLVLVMGRQ